MKSGVILHPFLTIYQYKCVLILNKNNLSRAQQKIFFNPQNVTKFK